MPLNLNVLGELYMLFASHSVHMIQGYINASSMPVFTAIFLSAFHGMFLPWFLPKQIIATSACFDLVWGSIFSLIGYIIGAIIGYLIGKIFFGRFLTKINELTIFVLAKKEMYFLCGILLICLGMIVPISILSGAFGFSFKKSIFYCALGEAVLICSYGFLCTSYVSILPEMYSLFLQSIGIFLVLLAMLRIRIKMRKEK